MVGGINHHGRDNLSDNGLKTMNLKNTFKIRITRKIQDLPYLDWTKVFPNVLENYYFLRTVEQMHQLTSSQTQAKLKISSPAFQALAANMSLTVELLKEKLSKVFAENSQLLLKIRGDL